MITRTVTAFCRKWDLLPGGGVVLCAVSGGRDSMALLHLLGGLAEELGFQVAAAHFNHQLRPTADRDEAFVRDWCRGKGIPFACGRGDVEALRRREGLSVEDAARRLRYAFLEDAARDMGADRIATAHHREDNAETVLLHLLRGSGPQGLGGIAPVRGKIVRPLLEVSRAEIDAYVARHGIPYVEDESNADPAFTRNRLRLEVLPLLEELAPGCAERIAGTAALVREENEHLQREADALVPAVEDGGVALPVSVLAEQDRALRRRLVQTMGRKLGLSLSRGQTEAVLALGSGGFLNLPGGVSAARTRRELLLRRQGPPLPPLELREGEQTWGPWRLMLRRSDTAPAEDASTVVLRADLADGLAVAAWDGTGRLAVENGSRTIKRLFADRGIPVDRRGEHPVLLSGGKPAAVFGVATDWARRPRPGEPCLVVELARERRM